jgi:signal transduction histidine kinase
MGGELWYEDVFPRGAKFSLRLPVPHAPPAQIVEPTRKIA